MMHMMQQSERAACNCRRLFDEGRLEVARCDSLSGWLIYDSALDEYIKYVFPRRIEASVVCHVVTGALRDLVPDTEHPDVLHNQRCMFASIFPELVVASYADQHQVYVSIVRELRFELLRLYVRTARAYGDIDACGVGEIVTRLIEAYQIYAERVAQTIVSTLERYNDSRDNDSA